MKVLFALWVLEVMKGLWAKKQAKMRKNHSESTENPGSQADTAARRSEQENDKQVSLQ
jgi:hypothetical protein